MQEKHLIHLSIGKYPGNDRSTRSDFWQINSSFVYIYNDSRQLTHSSVREARGPPSRLVFSKKRKRLTEFAVSSKGDGPHGEAGRIRILPANDRRRLRDHPRCPLLLLHRSRKGCGGRDARDTKRAETLSRNRNEAWSLRSALPGGRVRERG